jgi:hypothetical protein
VEERSDAADADAQLRAVVGHAAAPGAEDPVLAELVADAARTAAPAPPATAPSAIPPLHLSV